MCKDGDETLFCVRILPQSLYDLTEALLCSVQLASLSGDLQISELQQSHGRTENFLAPEQSGALSLVESFIELKYFHHVATPALLCHKEPARRIQTPLLGIGGFHARKGPIVGALMP